MEKTDRWALLIMAIGIWIAQLTFLYPQLGEADGVINGDGRGYYDYLTSVFIDHDLSNQEVNGRYILELDERGVNKYFLGTSILMLPFFSLAAVLSFIFGFPLDGFSLPFQWAMTVSALSYWVIGSYFLIRLLSALGLSRLTRMVVVLTLSFGTNALYYSSVDVTASHVYSFAAISAFLWFVYRWLRMALLADLFYSALLLGLVVTIRPVNGVILLFLPFLIHVSEVELWNVIRRTWNVRRSLLALSAVLLAPVIQLVTYNIQTDQWIVWSYAKEGFYFTNPAVWKFLVSFERGWLVYSPVFFFLIVALFWLLRNDRLRAFLAIAWTALLVYILSSWWSWHYGGSYGSRPMVDFCAAFAVMMTPWLSSLGCRPKMRLALMVVITSFSLLTWAQVYQLKVGILSAWHMNATKYMWSLGRLGDHEHGLIGGRKDTPPYHIWEEIWYEEQVVPSTGPIHWSFTAIEDDRLLLSAETPFNATFHYPVQKRQSAPVGIELSLERKELEADAGSSAYVVVELLDSTGNRSYYDAFLINDRPDLPVGDWEQWSYRYVIPETVENGDILKIYLWNSGGKAMEVRSLHLRLLGYY